MLLVCYSDRSGTFAMKNRLQNVSDIRISFSTSLVEIMRPSEWSSLLFRHLLHLSYWCRTFGIVAEHVKSYNHRNFKFSDVNVQGAERIAKICAEEGVPRFIQISHLNASATSQSRFYQTKAEGEERVKAAFPNATIIRPAAMYGYEDKLLNNIASESLHYTDMSPSLNENKC